MNWTEAGILLMGALLGGSYVALFMRGLHFQQKAIRLQKQLAAERDSRDGDTETVKVVEL